MGERLLDIGEVAERTGVAASALRYYERLGLLEPAGRNGLRRTYRPDALDRIALILNARAAGFSLNELGELLECAPNVLRTRLREKTQDIGRRIAALEETRDRLGHALTCRAPSLLDCPTFRAELRSSLPGH
ncbi:MerR family transcriptional regulator [Streptomyces sp. NPDC048639]|uniref:MerR family transcriptional regulator n=1 Tax=Streptomyces sp. NPDC048639 TaxID=3365581 RepID=UPI00371A4674